MDEYLRIVNKSERLVLGVMTGTSLDGLDLALVRLSGSGEAISMELVATSTEPMPDSWRTRIKNAFSAETGEICRINYDFAEFLSERILHFCHEHHLPLDQLDAIGCHGQTLHHVHHHSTLQTGEADVIAARTRTLVISDFRAADIAVGGSGAPLVPYFDQLLFRNRTDTVALQNIGGISNVTYLPHESDTQIIAFDTGPGNAILNELAGIISKGEDHCDRDAFLSKSGRCNNELLAELLKHPYFKLPPPKSTGREQFGADYVSTLLASEKGHALHSADLLRTLVSLVSHSIADAYRRFFPGKPGTVYLSGGGAHHPLILQELRDLLGPDKVIVFESINGITADTKEAVAFAVLAHERINHTPTNLLSVTGASRKTTLGKISAPYPV